MICHDQSSKVIAIATIQKGNGEFENRTRDLVHAKHAL